MNAELRDLKSQTVGACTPARLLALLPFFLLFFNSCITITPRTQRVSESAVVIPNVPMQKWGVESCGAGSLSTVLQHYGDSTTLAQWDASLPKTRGGVMTVDLLLAARQKGFDAKLVTGTPEIVTSELLQNRPVILMLQVVDSPGQQYDFFHYVVADGIDSQRGLIRTQFGDGKGRWVSFTKLEKPWTGGGHAAILIQPRSASDALRAAVALESEGRLGEAAAAYRALLARYGGTPLVWTNLGNAQMQLGQNADAESSFRKALELDPSFRDALNNLAWLLLQEKRLDEAETFARNAVAQNGPDPYVVLDTLARIQAARGACADAASTFHHALELVPAGHEGAHTDLEKAMSEAAASCREKG